MQKKLERFSKKLTEWIGSVSSLIVHSIFFISVFSLRYFKFSSYDVLLILNTIVSLEAIYLAIFLQLTVNKQSHELKEVSDNIEEIQEDVDEIQKDVDEIQEDIEEEVAEQK